MRMFTARLLQYKKTPNFGQILPCTQDSRCAAHRARTKKYAIIPTLCRIRLGVYYLVLPTQKRVQQEQIREIFFFFRV